MVVKFIKCCFPSRMPISSVLRSEKPCTTCSSCWALTKKSPPGQKRHGRRSRKTCRRFTQVRTDAEGKVCQHKCHTMKWGKEAFFPMRWENFLASQMILKTQLHGETDIMGVMLFFFFFTDLHLYLCMYTSCVESVWEGRILKCHSVIKDSTVYWFSLVSAVKPLNTMTGFDYHEKGQYKLHHSKFG